MNTAKQINPPVFYSSLIIALTIALFAAIFPDISGASFSHIQTWLSTNVSWLYVLSVAIFLMFVVFVMVSRLGDIKLGPDHSEPDYSNVSWFSMLFSAGMGIGLMFFGVAEPVMHYMSPPVGDAISIAAAQDAMRITFFHWGLHAWGIYAVVALALAYFSYRHKLPLLPRSALYPLIGDKIHGPIGHATDTFAVVGTLFGVATSLGFGVQQLNAGLHYLFGLPQTEWIQLLLVVVVIALATVSVVLGLDGGIKRLSNLNIILAVALLVAVLIFGPTELLLQSYVQNTGTYMSELVNSTFNLYAYDRKEDWIGGWTLLYWGWWVSWSPFVGTFIARVSRGRTIREFIVGVLFIPTGFTFLWMTVFGNTAIHMIAGDAASSLALAVNNDVATAIFVFFEQLPLSSLLSAIAVLLITTFFITSADSGALVIDTITAGGETNTPVWQRIFWTSVIGFIAAALLFAGGLSALQTLTIASAFPFMFVLLCFCYGLFKALKHDYMLQNSVQTHNTSVQFSKANISWKERLDSLLVHPLKPEAENFVSGVVRPALTQLVEQFTENELNAKLIEDSDKIRLTIYKEEAENFAYGVRLRHFMLPSYADEKHNDYYRAEVFLLQGGQQYDVFGYTEDQIIADVISQYERHLHFLYLASSEILEKEESPMQQAQHEAQSAS
ncbi:MULTISPECIES: BCCT family transporter [unclassified Agarivorans]|uniref:BCCT family transporter n=1 Tax=unclassified Agarivorans TaxID=2636026 RepID=UPI0026E2F581|nr:MULTISPECIES: BCCT family transporter [unclassified Agarivorans]MDO6687246.1 BCCT family transporter [Agarivorans sp. 3_MG-2023]MDO6716827.1 BCCT family transporter [Agarivorans sp. 2_MG-2023]